MRSKSRREREGGFIQDEEPGCLQIFFGLIVVSVVYHIIVNFWPYLLGLAGLGILGWVAWRFRDELWKLVKESSRRFGRWAFLHRVILSKIGLVLLAVSIPAACITFLTIPDYTWATILGVISLAEIAGISWALVHRHRRKKMEEEAAEEEARQEQERERRQEEARQEQERERRQEEARQEQERERRQEEARAEWERDRRREEAHQEQPGNAVLDAYRVLGCRPGDSMETISRAFRDKVRPHHPDFFSGPDVSKEAWRRAGEITKKISAAYTTIKEDLRGRRSS
jgi:FtsZ-interacting cell division protein YlmF